MKHRTVFTWAILCLLTVVVFAAPAMAQETATEPVVIIVSQSLDAWEADAKLTAEVPHLILEQLAKRLHQL